MTDERHPLGQRPPRQRRADRRGVPVTDVKALLALARAAQPEAPAVGWGHVVAWRVHPAVMRFVCAASPDAIAALCEQVEALERALATEADAASTYAERGDAWRIDRDAWKADHALQSARISALEAGLKEACDGWAQHDSDGFDIKERDALRSLAEGK